MSSSPPYPDRPVSRSLTDQEVDAMLAASQMERPGSFYDVPVPEGCRRWAADCTDEEAAALDRIRDSARAWMRKAAVKAPGEAT